MKPSYTKKWKRRIKYILLIIVTCYLLLCFYLRLPARDAAKGTGDCMLYYIINVDGMKGLGHSIILLLNEQGEGTVLSFNGMQRTLGEALLGQAGVGKLSVGSMNSSETATFLNTGDLDLEGDQLKDNYDIALYRPITRDEYYAVIALIEPYIQTASEFERLYILATSSTDADERAVYEAQLQQMGQDTSLPLYQIYIHNCDHAARYFASAADADMTSYNAASRRLTPNGNFKAFARQATDWGVLRLGEISLSERILEFSMIF